MNAGLQLAGRALTVGAYAIAEKVRPPVPRTAEDVPISGSRVTVEWLSAVLCRDVPGARVLTYENPGGSSGSTERVALRVTYNDAGRQAGLPTDLFTKGAESYKQRMLTGGGGVVEGEVHFYRTLRDRTTAEAPRGYWAAADPRSWRSITIMEDISVTKGARFIGPTERLTREQMHDLVRNLAAFHGDLWEDPALRPLSTTRDYIERTQALLNLTARSKVGMDRAREEIPDALHGRLDQIVDGTIRSMTHAATGMPRTLLHGDAHVGQTYITRDGAMGYADWHHVLQGGWAFDYAYCVNSACEPADRRAWERELMETYLDALTRQRGEAPSFEDAWLAYRQQSFWPFIAWVFTIGRAWYQPEMQPVDRCKAIIRRTGAAIADLDSFGALQL